MGKSDDGDSAIERAPGKVDEIAPRGSSGESLHGALGDGGEIIRSFVPSKTASLHRCSVARASIDRNLRSNHNPRSNMETIYDDVVTNADLSARATSSISLANSWISGDRIIGKTTTSKGCGGSMTLLVQCVVVLSLIGMLALTSLAIGYTVVKYRLNRIVGGTGEIVDDGDDESREQELLEMAEHVVLACSEETLDADMSECQELCHSRMCCFETGIYSCEEEEGRDCAVYAGCEALVGVPSDL